MYRVIVEKELNIWLHNNHRFLYKGRSSYTGETYSFFYTCVMLIYRRDIYISSGSYSGVMYRGSYTRVMYMGSYKGVMFRDWFLYMQG